VISPRLIAPLRWTAAGAILAAIVAVYRLWLHVNPTTVALTLLLLTLSLAARWGLRYAVVVSVAATLCYNFFFLPPLGTWTITDPQNWIALLAFLITSVIASRLSIRIREEALEARRREHEVEVLFQLSRELLQTDNVVELLRTVPDSIARVAGTPSVAVYLTDDNKLYRSASFTNELTEEHPQELTLLPRVTRIKASAAAAVPLRTGVRPRGVLLLGPTILSDETLEALGGLVSISIDRVQALENAARSEAAKESERLRSLMLDSITHELRTPLTAIKASATTMLSSESLRKEDQHELLTVIDEETDRLNRLIAQAVEMAQLDTQEIHMNLQPVSIDDVLKQSLRACATQLAARPLNVASDSNLPRVFADGTWLQKAFSNLIENAAKYSPPGSPITLRAASDGDIIAVHVTDRGVGIAVSEQVLIFEKFYRGRAHANRWPGTGMGLAISRAIIEAHRGTLRVSSAPGEGSTFTVQLPVWRGTNPPGHH
jgi:two-component system, OmpR family, sensor histidine kinase KdpD